MRIVPAVFTAIALACCALALTGCTTQSATVGESSSVQSLNVVTIYGWDRRFAADTETLIAETRKAGFWSGSKNRATEPRRVEIARRLMLAEKSKTLAVARAQVKAQYPASKLNAHLKRVQSGSPTGSDRAMRDAITRSYHDALFSSLMRAIGTAQERVGGCC